MSKYDFYLQEKYVYVYIQIIFTVLYQINHESQRTKSIVGLGLVRLFPLDYELDSRFQVSRNHADYGSANLARLNVKASKTESEM